MTLQYVDRVPTPEEHRRLAESVGWTHAFDWDAMPASLAASVCGVVVERAGETVAMGRVVGDGVFYFYVQDVVVLPELHLFAAGESTRFYERHGFAVHAGMTGMFRVVPSRT